MKFSLSRLLLLVLFVAACLVTPPSTLAQQQDLRLEVSLLTGEHSRDSGSMTRVFHVAGNTLLFEETYSGMRGNLSRPLKKEVSLTNADRDRLIQLLKEKNLIRNKEISKSAARPGPNRYFELSVVTSFGQRQGRILITAPTSATELKADPLYQNSLLLMTEIYRIINRSDPNLKFDNPIK